MPITDNGFEYEIPEQIKNLITIDFSIDFKKNLDRIFKINTKETINSRYFYLEGTYGCNEAMESSCSKFKLDKLYKYYRSLPWYDSDLLDDELCRTLVKYKIIEEGNDCTEDLTD